MTTGAPAEELVPGPARRRATVVHVTTVPNSLYFLSGQTRFMRERGFELHFVSSPTPTLARFEQAEGVRVHAVEMTREITPVHDLGAVARLTALLRRLRPDIVHAHTPKAGLLGMLAGAIARVPVRIYHVRGLPLETANGARRVLLRRAEQTSCVLAHRIIAVSASLRARVVDEGLCPAEKIVVLAQGSGNGVDATHRYRPADAALRRAARAERGIPDDAVTVGFIGRLTRDKGILELAMAWRSLRDRAPRARLLVIGAHEGRDATVRAAIDALAADPRVHVVPGMRFADMPRAYAAMDVLALPTYREGFPNVALEAAAMALPVVATAVTGCVDAVVDGVTGALVPAHDAIALAGAIERYVADPALRVDHGDAGRRRVLAEFRPEGVWKAIADEYAARLAEPRA